MENRKREVLIIAIVLIIQSIVFVICGMNKSYIHMDEAYSLGLASYDKTEIQDNEDFYDNWHNNGYYEDYLSVEDDEIGKYSQVYENQKNDVHPPLYYLLLRFSMGFSRNHFSMWTGIILNIVIYMGITVFMYLIIQKLLENQTRVKEKAIILSFISAITMASLSNVIYIRMYALATLNILITTFLHMKLLEAEKLDIKLLVFIGISALVGSLTHYYYLFYLAMMYIIFAIIYIKNKKIKMLIAYTISMAIAGISSLLIFPYSIQHMFFGYRGQGVISNLTDISKFANSIRLYFCKIDDFAFNNVLFVIIALMVVFFTYRKLYTQNAGEKRSKFMKIIELPTLFYFILVSLASPWIELRYIMPICGLVFVIIIYYLYKILQSIFTEKTKNIVTIIVFVVILLAPICFKIEPEVMYSNRKDVVSKFKNELNVPTVYFFSSGSNRFLDDILLFSIIDESYIAKDIEYTEENVSNILQGKDISRGIAIFININQNNDYIIDVVKKSTGFENCEHIKKLNECDVYYLN